VNWLIEVIKIFPYLVGINTLVALFMFFHMDVYLIKFIFDWFWRFIKWTYLWSFRFSRNISCFRNFLLIQLFLLKSIFYPYQHWILNVIVQILLRYQISIGSFHFIYQIYFLSMFVLSPPRSLREKHKAFLQNAFF
jgi:hypothetical protein